jgi:RHS repeat-associated protein
MIRSTDDNLFDVGDQTMDAGRYLYHGDELDVEAGLQYNRARHYDPETGRWLSEDPIGFAGDPSNLYRYVGNSPTNGTDPSGNVAPVLIGTGFAATAWVTIRGWLSIEVAEKTFADDKQQHCMAACVFNDARS